MPLTDHMLAPRPIARLIEQIFPKGKGTAALMSEIKVKTDLNPKHEPGTIAAIRSDYMLDPRHWESITGADHYSTIPRAIKYTLIEHVELYPLFSMGVVWAVLAALSVYYALTKREIYRKKGYSELPDDWERDRAVYNTHHATFFDRLHPNGATHERLPELELLEDELLQAAKERGTRHDLEMKHLFRQLKVEEYIPRHYD